MTKRSIFFDTSQTMFTEIKDINESFATGRLKILYLGKNRNGSSLTEEVVEAALPSLKNVPIVAHYKREENLIGSHDIDVELDDDKTIQLINLTEPCGVIPESATFSFEDCLEADGTIKRYLVADNVILWKRQQVYKHITDDLNGVVKHSMEIDISDFRVDDEGYLEILGFQFNALCLLEECEPCFEGSALTMYSALSFAESLSLMTRELQNLLGKNSLDERFLNMSEKGGKGQMDTNKEKVFETSLSFGSLRASTFENDGVEEDTKVLVDSEDAVDSDEPESTESDTDAEDAKESEDADIAEPAALNDIEEPEELQNQETAAKKKKCAPKKTSKCALTSEVFDKLTDSLRSQLDFAWVIDIDEDIKEVYYESYDPGFYGAMYDENYNVDLTTASRKKWIIAEYSQDGGHDRFFGIEERFSTLEAELQELRQFKYETEKAELETQKQELFMQFDDLKNVDDFKKLMADNGSLSLEALEEKLYAIRGKQFIVTKQEKNFSKKEKGVKIHVADKPQEQDRYGGLFEKYLGKK